MFNLPTEGVNILMQSCSSADLRGEDTVAKVHVGAPHVLFDLATGIILSAQITCLLRLFHVSMHARAFVRLQLDWNHQRMLISLSHPCVSKCLTLVPLLLPLQIYFDIGTNLYTVTPQM